jgi:hypothetical protein
MVVRDGQRGHASDGSEREKKKRDAHSRDSACDLAMISKGREAGKGRCGIKSREAPKELETQNIPIGA